LERAGYRVVSVNYPSWRVPVERLSDEHLHNALTQRAPADATRVHFITHSFGGILLRQYLLSHEMPNLGRVVMLGPPNHGTDFVDRWLRHEPLRWLAGPNLSQLGTMPDNLPARLGPVNFELGVIAGDRPWLGVAFGREVPNDGKVSLTSAKIEGMKDFTVVHCSHTFIMRKRETLELISKFLEHGQFQPREN
ncbi:MAG: alpha/beta hydrolase, partial [Verrucomicrobia bacterium]|nr:alpha/beta hydrolase [Verrucomicrobiota bacterium]